MRRSNSLLLLGGLMVATALAAAACGSSTPATTTTTTTTTPAVTTTETFSGSLSLNGAASYNFAVTAAGSVTATLATLSGGPASVTIGLSLGTWNGTSCTTGSGLFTDTAIQGTAISGSVSTAGSLCVRVYDASALLTTPVSYTLTVVHP